MPQITHKYVKHVHTCFTLMCVIWFTCTWPFTCACRVACICVMCRLYIRAMPYAYMGCVAFTFVISRIHMAFICVTYIHTCDMAYLHVWHISTVTLPCSSSQPRQVCKMSPWTSTRLLSFGGESLFEAHALLWITHTCMHIQICRVCRLVVKWQDVK